VKGTDRTEAFDEGPVESTLPRLPGIYGARLQHRPTLLDGLVAATGLVITTQPS
jgi:hypothetical protein